MSREFLTINDIMPGTHFTCRSIGSPYCGKKMMKIEQRIPLINDDNISIVLESGVAIRIPYDVEVHVVKRSIKSQEE